MKKTLLLIMAPFVFLSALSAQITQKEANGIALKRLSKETQTYVVYAQREMQKKMIITSIDGKELEISYPCWVYYVRYANTNQSRYLIVKESNGNLLEVNAKIGAEPKNLNNVVEWIKIHDYFDYSMDILKGEWSWFYTSKGGTGNGSHNNNNSFQSTLKILSQNEDGSINYEVYVKDTLFISPIRDIYQPHYWEIFAEETLFYQGSFQFQPSEGGSLRSADIKLPYKLWREGDQLVLYPYNWFIDFEVLSTVETNEIVLEFWDGGIGGNFFYYRKIKKE